MSETTISGWQTVEVAGVRLEVRVDAAAPYRGRRLWPSVGEYPVYDEFLYYVMLQDEPRNRLFGAAVSAQAPGRTVVELGTGPDLLWSTLAAKHGARRVLAVEALEQSARQATRRAAELGPHVSVVHGNATAVRLPERGDMCVAELVGAIGGAEGIAEAVADAWKRHLNPGAVVVPNRVRTRFAAVDGRRLLGGAPTLHPDVVPYLGQVLRSVGSVFDLRMCLSGLTTADLVTTSQLLEDLDLAADEQHHADRLQLEVTRPGAIDSGLLWLELQCADDQEVLDSLATVTNWMPVLLPFDLAEPVPVGPGDVVRLDVDRRLFDDVHPEWTFTGAIERRDGSHTPLAGLSPYGAGPFRSSWLHRELFRRARPDHP